LVSLSILAVVWAFVLNTVPLRAMVTHGEHVIRKIVAVVENGIPIPPCGRCREFMHQIHEENIDAEVIIGKNKSVKLKDLLPLPWDAKG